MTAQVPLDVETISHEEYRFVEVSYVKDPPYQGVLVNPKNPDTLATLKCPSGLILGLTEGSWTVLRPFALAKTWKPNVTNVAYETMACGVAVPSVIRALAEAMMEGTLVRAHMPLRADRLEDFELVHGDHAPHRRVRFSHGSLTLRAPSHAVQRFGGDLLCGLNSATVRAVIES
jgi:hypothetical protein